MKLNLPSLLQRSGRGCNTRPIGSSNRPRRTSRGYAFAPARSLKTSRDPCRRLGLGGLGRVRIQHAVCRRRSERMGYIRPRHHPLLWGDDVSV